MRIDERVRDTLTATTRFGHLHLLDTVDSTNRVAHDAAVAGAAEGLVVVADHQRAGRGRIGRSWEARPGTGLLVSILLRPGDLAGRLHLVTAAVGLSAAAALDRVAGLRVDLKWPNDLLVGDRKLAGILAEVVDVGTAGPAGTAGTSGPAGTFGTTGTSGPARPAGSAAAVVVGIGVNVSEAPVGAVSVAEATGRDIERSDLLVALLEELEARYGHWDAVGLEYRRTCATVGRRVRVEGPGGSVRTGTATAVDEGGRLVLADDATGAEVALSVGDVVHVRPGDPGAPW